MKFALAEFIGTFTLVLFGCGAAVIAGEFIGYYGIAFAFGLALIGVSVNPARSIGPALFAGAHAMSQLWLFILAPVLGGLAAGALFRSGALNAEPA